MCVINRGLTCSNNCGFWMDYTDQSIVEQSSTSYFIHVPPAPSTHTITLLSTKCCADEDISPPNSKCIRDDPDNVDYFVNVHAKDLVNEREKDKEVLQRYQEALQRHQDHIHELEDKVQHKTMMLDIMTDNVERPEAEVKNHRNECYDTIVSGMECSNMAACISLMKDEIVELLEYAKL
ncbi:hypothetical protein EDB19DRAFT_1831168 [Suillus lakei]|nr:hypothetical protein EDB19DRAFT_1831168 [Suillus lakei]